MGTGSPGRAVLIIAAGLGAAAALAACRGSTGSTAAPTPTASVTTPVASATAPAGPGACPTRSLGVKAGTSQGTAGSVYTNIVFTNISEVTCTLYGYPGVSFTANRSGSQVQVGAAASRNPIAAPELVTLAPRSVAHALLRIVDADNYPQSACGPVTADFLQIYPPGQTTPIYLGHTSPACSKPVHILSVSVVQPGAGT
jgi:Protein of unknown function (DUF4232)